MRLLWFLALVCFGWAQIGELVTDWHGEGNNGRGYHQPGEAGRLYSRRFHTLRLTGDTLWVLGRVCVPAEDTAFLPNPTGAPIELNILPPVSYRREASYIALYHRVRGEFLGALLAYAQPGAQYGLRFVDFVLSADRDTLWVSVDFPTGTEICTERIGPVVVNPQIVWQDPTGGTFTLTATGCPPYTMELNQYTSQVWQLSRLRQAGPTGWDLRRECFYWNANEALSVGLHGLTYRPGEIFVSGTIRLPNGSSNSAITSNLKPSTLAAAYGGSGDPTDNPACPFWVKLSTGASFSAVAASILHREGTGVNVQGYGRSLLLKGDTLIAFFNLYRDGSGDGSMRYKAFSGGPLSFYPYAVQASSCQPHNTMRGHVCVTALRAADLKPIASNAPNPFTASTHRLFCGDYFIIPTVGTLYPWLSGDTLWLMWNDDRSLSISTMSRMRGLFSYWTGVNTWSLSLGFGMPWVAIGTLWTGMTRTPEGYFLFSGHQLHSGEPVLGYRTPAATGLLYIPQLQFNLWGPESMEITGITSDAGGHLYLFGTGRVENFLYTRVRPRARVRYVSLGNLQTTIHASEKVGYGRSWIGRVVRYRIELLEGSFPASTCSPDTLERQLTFRLYGRFDAPSDSIALLWNSFLGSPTHYNTITQARWNIGALLPPPGGVDSITVSISPLSVKGRATPGIYIPQVTVAGWLYPPPLPLQGAFSMPQLSATGNKAPSLYPTEEQRYWVYPFIGGSEATEGWREAARRGPFRASKAYLDGNASVSPHYAFAYVPADPELQKELVYVAINYSDSVWLYRVDLGTGWAEHVYGWPRIPTSHPTWDASLDSVADGIQQLVWNPQTGSLLAVEGTYRLRVIFPAYLEKHTVFPRSVQFIIVSQIGGDPSHFPIVSTVSSYGEVTTTFRTDQPGFRREKTYLVRDNLNVGSMDIWSFRMIAEGEEDSDPCLTLPERIAAPRALCYGEVGSAVLYFVDWGKVGASCDAYALLLRSSVEVGGQITFTTLDTLYSSTDRSDLDSVRMNMVYQSKPAPHLILPLRLPSGEGYILRYWLDGRSNPKDTLIGGVLVGDWSCEYSVDRWSPQTFPRAISLEVTRGGMILWSASEREIRAALPLYINRANLSDTARWLAPAPISDASSGRDVQLSWTDDTLRWAVDSLHSPRDTLSLGARVSPCGGSWPLTHYAVTLPSSPVATEVPTTLCQGEVFPVAVTLPNDDLFTLYLHSVGKPTECGVQKLIEAIQMSSSASISPAGRVQRLQNGLYVAIDTCISPACQVQLGLPTGLQAESPWLLQLLEGYSTATGNFRIRRGHQVVVRAALEAPDRGDGTLSPHPAFSRLGLYRAARGNALGDSLTEWGVLGTLPSFWEASPSAWRRINGAGLSDTSTTPAAWRVPSWVTPVLILLREAPDGPTVDSVWGFVDTLGRIWKWAPPMVDTTDCNFCSEKQYYQPWRLSFCRCDTTAPKWIVLRFPQHLPLRSAQAMDLSRNPAQPSLVDFRDPTYVEGIPGEHYALISRGGGIMQAAAWAGNCADQAHAHWSGMPQAPDWGVINAADYEFILMRNGVTGPSTFTPADIDCDGDVDAVDVLKVIQSQNMLRQSSVRN